MLDPVRTGDSQTMCVRVDSLSTTAKVIEFRLSKVAICFGFVLGLVLAQPFGSQVSEKERADQLQALLVMVRGRCNFCVESKSCPLPAPG